LNLHLILQGLSYLQTRFKSDLQRQCGGPSRPIKTLLGQLRAFSSMSSSKRCRLRELIPNLPLGVFSPGPKNSITDIPGVLASTVTLIDAPKIVTGVTAILPRKDIFRNACFAGIFRFNGNGELTGSHWVHETGHLSSPIMITNTFAIGAVSEGVLRYIEEEEKNRDPTGMWWGLPVVV
jgi:D-aminopeptidase